MTCRFPRWTVPGLNTDLLSGKLRPGQTALWAGAAALLLAVVVAQTLRHLVLHLDVQKLQQTARQRYGAGGMQQVQSWLDMLTRSRNLPQQDVRQVDTPDPAFAQELAQLRAVNTFWNQAVTGGEDIDVWQQVDYWATPLESLGRRLGDCEDYVIGKYFSLVALGVVAEKLRFIYVRANLGGTEVAHMVLGYYSTPDAMPLVLDNLYSTIEPANNRPDLTPVFSFNASGVYIAGKQASPVERIGRWNDLLLRMQGEGISFRQASAR